MSMVKSVHLGKKILKKLEEESSKEECSQSYIIRKALREYFGTTKSKILEDSTNEL
jgi:metal-responsive CopG/Arc/MetJ family transcriptional regulator